MNPRKFKSFRGSIVQIGLAFGTLCMGSSEVCMYGTESYTSTPIDLSNHIRNNWYCFIRPNVLVGYMVSMRRTSPVTISDPSLYNHIYINSYIPSNNTHPVIATTSALLFSKVIASIKKVSIHPYVSINPPIQIMGHHSRSPLDLTTHARQHLSYSPR